MISKFIIYDLVFLVLFLLGIAGFLYVNRSRVSRQGLMYLYRTSWGIKLISSTSLKFGSLIKGSRNLVIATGSLLMVSMIYLLIQFSWTYLSSPTIAKDLRVPVIMPLIPYLPELFGLTFLPPFYFTYWILIIALIAIPHEFFHGIYARIAKVKVHSTGFGFLGPFLAAFVEPDETQMAKVSKKDQLAILASGTFANVLTAIVIAVLFAIFFMVSFAPSGVLFSAYSSSTLPVSALNITNSTPLEDIGQLPSNFNNRLIQVSYNLSTYYVLSDSLQIAISDNYSYIQGIDDSPAFKVKLSGPILAIDGIKTNSYESLREILSSKSPGDKITISTLDKDGTSFDTLVTLSERNGKAFLGIATFVNQKDGLLSGVYSLISNIKDPDVYYSSSFGSFGIFIYNLLWWSLLITISVALVNMLPIGMFDGGRFFMIIVSSITGSEKLGMRAFKISTSILLGLVALLMVKWAFIFF